MRRFLLSVTMAVFGQSSALAAQLCSQDVDSPVAPAPHSWFGASVAVDGPWVAIGAPRDFGTTSSDVGTVSLYFRNSVTDRLEFTAELMASDATADDRFGSSVDLDGEVLVVGARAALNGFGARGAAYVFELSGGTWSQVAKLVSLEPSLAAIYGNAVGVSGDRIVVGQSASRPVDVYRRGPMGGWSHEEELVADGGSVAIDTSVICTESGVFRRDSVFGTWIQEFTIPVVTSCAVSGNLAFHTAGSNVFVVERDTTTGIWSTRGSFNPGFVGTVVQSARPGLLVVSGQTAGRDTIKTFGDGFATSTGFGELGLIQEREPGVANYARSAAVDGNFLIAGAPLSTFLGSRSGRIYQYDLRCDPIQSETSCFQGAQNSTAATGRMDVFGQRSIAANDMTLQASLVPTFTFGIFVTSLTEGLSVMPGGSDGNLCLAGAIGRFVGPGQIVGSGADGRFELPVDLNQIPTPLSLTAAVPGDRYFQAWHRDLNPGQTSNFTDAIRVSLAP